MKIHFSIHFNTRWGEELFITGSSRQLGNHDAARALKLNYIENGLWEGEINCNPARERLICYKYFVKNDQGEIFYEAGPERSLALNIQTREIRANDQWTGNTSDGPFLSAPFSEVFFTDRTTPYTQTQIHSREIIIQVTVPNVPLHCSVKLCGSTELLGSWDPEKAVKMNRQEGVRWEANIPAEGEAGKEWEYKFIIEDRLSGQIVWENGPNRKLNVPEISKNSTFIIDHASADVRTERPRYAGCVVPVFSLRSKESHGIGDFRDLRLLIDWARRTGQSVIQLLPVNDTSVYLNRKDSYPYNCISTIALHPIYLNPEEMGTLKDPVQAKEFKQEGKLLNHQVHVDYEEVWDSKMRYFRALYRQEKENTFAEPGYYTFTKQNKEWLYPYAAFCVLRDRYGTSDFSLWEKYSVYKEETIAPLFSKNSKYSDEIYFYIYLQYHLCKQLSRAKEYAHLHGVALKGDIPIGISRHSAEAWQYPYYFNFGQQAGAPPDAFSDSGQNWGFPTYNWERMEQDDYKWWKNRLFHLSKYFNAYRIDHILGFFRIWEIPVGFKESRMGHFHPASPLSEEEITQADIPFHLSPDKSFMAGRSPEKEKYNGLFIEDPYEHGKFHPAIDGLRSSEYQALTPAQQEAYNRLYHYFFYERNNQLWYDNAMKKLRQLIAASNMLTCGEDLGMLNESVHRCMARLNILSLEVEIMPKEYGRTLADPAGYPYSSVCATSTHDTPTLRMWLGKLLNTSSETDTETGLSIPDASPEECLKVLRRNLSAPSMLAIFPLQDWLSINGKLRNKYVNSERINDPADPDHEWKYRMHLDLEDLNAADAYNSQLRELLEECNRSPVTFSDSHNRSDA